MDIIKSLIAAKEGNPDSINAIIKHYEKFIYFDLNKYNIQDKSTCYENIKSNIMKAIYLFKIQEKFS